MNKENIAKNPIIAIVGKPNVGKSTFFNRLIGRRISITSEIAGTTRDRIIANIEWQGNVLTFIDTAGLDDLDTKETLTSMMTQQVDEALGGADLILFMLDGTDTITKSDLKIAEKLRKSDKPIIVLVNKAESYRVSEHLGDYFKFGLGEPLAISAIHGNGVAEVLDKIVNIFKIKPEFELQKVDEAVRLPKVALVGRPNVGKSTLLNQITNTNRAIVSDIPGTTRDSVNSKVIVNNREFILIDTAGVRKSGKIGRSVEKFSVLRTLRAIKESDLVVVLIDGTEGFVRGDIHLITQALEVGKQVLIGINKMDVAEVSEINIHKFSFVAKLPYVYISAKTGKSVEVLLGRICQLLG